MKRAWIALCALALFCGAARAEAATYWCEPLHAYYPAVTWCPSPWQAADAPYGPQPLAIPPASNTAGYNAQAQQNPPASSEQPTFPAPPSFIRGDVLDQWCRGSTTALLTAVCGDDDLRGLAVQRLYAFEETKARLNADQQKALIADQNKWALSYPQTCGLKADVRPSSPLAAPLKDCLEKAGQARLQYLKDYGLPDAEKTAAASPPIAAPTPPAAANPAPAAPAPATPAPNAATGPPGTQSPASATPPPAAPAAPQNNEAHQSATAAIPPAATPAKPAPADTGSQAVPHPNSPLSKIGDYTRIGAMLIAVFVVFIWAVTAWLRGRSRRPGKPAETRQ